MVTRDPETGQFQAGTDDGRGPADPYLNNHLMFSANSWDLADRTTFDEVDGRDAVKTVDIERPDDYLVEIHGFRLHIGDPLGEGGDAKFDVFVSQDAAPPMDTGWQGIMEALDDDIIWSASVSANEPNGGFGRDRCETWFDKPLLTDGELELLARASPAGAGGEIAGTVYYTLRQFDEMTVLRQLLKDR